MNELLSSISQSEWDALIVSIIKNFLPYCYSSSVIDFEDLRQEAWLALANAADNFDPNKGVKFTTYASRCIYNRALQCLITTSKKNVPHLEEGAYDRSDVADVEDMAIEDTDFMKIVRKLISQHEYSYLIEEIFIKGKKQADIAREEGVSPQAISVRLNGLLSTLAMRLNHANY